MIIVRFYRKENGEISGFQFKGHADAGEEGYDILCSAVSALAISAANSIETLTETKICEESSADMGYLKVKLKTDGLDKSDRKEESSHDAQLLLRSLELSIMQLAGSYPGNIRIVTCN